MNAHAGVIEAIAPAASPAGGMELLGVDATRAIRAAMANLTRANPPPGRHLAAVVRTGPILLLPPRPARPDHVGTLTRSVDRR